VRDPQKKGGSEGPGGHLTIGGQEGKQYRLRLPQRQVAMNYTTEPGFLGSREERNTSPLTPGRDCGPKLHHRQGMLAGASSFFFFFLCCGTATGAGRGPRSTIMEYFPLARWARRNDTRNLALGNWPCFQTCRKKTS